MYVLKVDHLTKIFTSGFWPFKKLQSYTAVNDISFQLNKSEILGFLGPNGAGKTTTIQMLLGTLTPTHGSINYFGADFAQHRIASLKKIGYASGYDKLPAHLTVYENLDVVARMYGLTKSQRMHHIDLMLESFNVTTMRHCRTGTLSAGQSTRVMLAKAFLANPSLILLDEPTASLDPDIAYEVREFIITQQKERGISMLITSHNMEEVTQLCDRVIVLKHGAIVANDKPDTLAQSIAQVRIHLTITHNIESALAYLNSRLLSHTFKLNELTVELDEHSIADFLMQLSHQAIVYSHISIDKPTLEDYFLSIAK